MNLGNLYYKTRQIIIEPLKAWSEIYDENKDRKEIIIDYLLPMSGLVAICSLLGNIIGGSLHDTFSFAYIFFNCLISFLIIFLEVYLAGWLISEVASSFNSKSESDRIFNLVVYSHAPFFLSLAFIKILPAMFFVVVIGFYSFYLYWLGMEKMAGLKSENRGLFILLSGLIMIAAYSLLTIVFNSIYEVIIEQIVNFRAV